MRAAAFCPGHITGFFQICEHDEILRTGSRGAGMCITLGARSHVDCVEGEGRIEVTINGSRERAPVTVQAIASILQGRRLDVRVSTQHDLPVSQGFGMSAAGAISATLALAEVLDLSMEEALRASHEAEILHRSGLGDVAALSRGGIVFRRREGLPPFGRVDRIAHEVELVIGVVGPPIITSSVLGEEGLRRRINRVGAECVSCFESSPTLATLFRLSREFVCRTGLMSQEVKDALGAIDAYGPASMVMLGNSIFATGDLEEQERTLSEFGESHRVGIDWKGPRVTLNRTG